MFEIGGSLREARLKRDLTPADVQKAIRIRDRYLQALEEERWELLPGDAYVKGFLRTYADYLGLDGSLYVEEYNSRFAQPDEPQLVPERFARRRTPLAGVGLLGPLVAVCVIVAIVGAVAVIAAWQLGGSSGNGQGTPSSSAPTTTAAHHSTPPKKRAHKTHHAAVALPSRAVLVAARGNCWLDIHAGSKNGALIYEGTLAEGKQLPVKLTSGPVWMTVGNPPALDVRLGDKVAPGLPPQAGNVLVTRRGIRPA